MHTKRDTMFLFNDPPMMGLETLFIETHVQQNTKINPLGTTAP